MQLHSTTAMRDMPSRLWSPVLMAASTASQFALTQEKI
jgi:hypothetical protein